MRGRPGTWPKFFGVAAAMAAATFFSGLGYPVDANATQAGAGDHPAQVAGGGANGIYNSPVLNYAVPQTFDGTSINWVSGAFDDGGPTSGDWDVNFWGTGSDPNRTFTFFAIGDYNDAFVISGTNVALLQSGATIGPSSTFSDGSGTVAPDDGWLAGVDGYFGFKFDCDGRLANPVAGGVCYGYAHVTTTGPSTGFPATIVEYSFDGDGNPISIGPVETFTVTPSVGTPSGTITPASPQTVNSGATTSFTLTADAGFHVDTVGGTCGGTLAGNVYTTSAVTADCTVIANFAVGEPAPVISATPSPMAIAVDAGATAMGTLTVKNTGGGTLTYSIAEAGPTAKATSYLTARGAQAAQKSALPQQVDVFARNPFARGGSGVKASGKPVVLDDLAISQMQNNTPAAPFGVSCPGAPTSWWRRFYFSEHAGVGATANVASVTIASETDAGSPLPLTINLYTIAHSTAVDTIPTSGLTLIGSATGTIEGALQTATFPVVGTVDDTAGKDLVVEWHTENPDALNFFPGANGTTETHPTFLSAEACGNTEPTPAADVGPGFPDFHIIMVVNLGDGAPPATCDNPNDVPWLSVTPATGSLAGGASADSTVTVDASTLAAGSYSANLCVTSNDTVNPLLTIPLSVTVAALPPGDPCSAADTIFCDGFDGSAPTGDIYDSGLVNLDVPNDFDGIYINWPDGSHCTDGACGGNLNLYSLPADQGGDDGIRFFWPNNGGGNEAGVGDNTSGTYAILASGAVIGPDSEFTAAAATSDTSNWEAGVDGYLGFKFECAGPASGVCYGYVHLTTTAPLGFPATVVQYWYDTSGAAITIP